MMSKVERLKGLKQKTRHNFVMAMAPAEGIAFKVH